MENKKPKPQLVQIQPQKSIALTVQRWVLLSFINLELYKTQF